MKQPFISKTSSPVPTQVKDVGEKVLIERIRAWLGSGTPPPPGGMGDDCAVLQPTPSGKKQLLTTDSISYGQHFDDSVSAKDAGAKLIQRNLSDIAAMGGYPGPALLNLLCGPDLSILWLEQFISGIRESCERYEVKIVGGDVSQLAPGHFSAALTLTGHCSSAPALRSTARIGDVIYVTGKLGGSILGKHFRFEPRLAEGQWLARQPECTAMMDLTDGLGKDLAALLPEGSSAAIDMDALPLSPEAHQCARADGISAEEHAFCDGEDYELLFTVAAEANPSAFESKWTERFHHLEISRIGRIVEAHPNGIYLHEAGGEALPWQSGFEHFKKA